MNKVDCSNVYVKTSDFSNTGNVFDGVFAKIDFKKGDLIEKGIVRILSDNNNKVFDGNNNPHVFTWSNDIPNYTWAFGSGCITFYNTSLTEEANTKMIRYFNENRFEIYAIDDIKANDELTHTYKSLEWRPVFNLLYDSLNT
tara:strand:- start:1630 stop:2055 length:426 start_codon:yes stop_codon:yes gene_type:complete